MAKTDKYELQAAETFTFNNDGTVAQNESMVGLVAAGQVGLGADGDAIFGKAWRVEERGAVMVQYSGIFVAPYSGAAPAVGVGQSLALDGAGKVKSVAAGSGSVVDIIDIDTANTNVVFVLR